MLTAAAGMVAERIPGPIDQEALLDKARQRACTTCSMRKSCLDQAQLTVQLLEYPLDAQCRKAGRLQEALLDKARQRACTTCSMRKSCLDQAQLTVQLLEYPLDAQCRKAGRLIPELRDKARQRACTTCSMRKSCLDQAQLTVQLLEYPLDAQCRKAGRLIPELRRAQDQLRWMKADRLRQQEYRQSLIQQYRFLGNYLRTLADGLPRHSTAGDPSYRVEVSARSHGKEAANGDVCLTFSGTECRYFVALCDGMGTGLGAAQDSREVARLLRKMLTAGFPPEHALPSINSLLTLGSSAGAATMDLAELRLDTGSVTLYKWGAAPSWLLRRSGAEKIGTATPPPGLGIATMDLAELRLDTGSVTLYKWGAAPSWLLRRSGAEKIGTATPPPGLGIEPVTMAVRKLSLRQGEALILLSDGVDGEEAADFTQRWRGRRGSPAPILFDSGCAAWGAGGENSGGGLPGPGGRCHRSCDSPAAGEPAYILA